MIKMKKTMVFKVKCVLLALMMMCALLPTTVFAAALPLNLTDALDKVVAKNYEESLLKLEGLFDKVFENGMRYTLEDIEAIESVRKSFSPGSMLYVYAEKKITEENITEIESINKRFAPRGSRYQELLESNALTAGCGNPIVNAGTQFTGDICARYGNYGSCTGSVYYDLYNCSPSCGYGYTGYKVMCSKGHFLSVNGQVAGNH